MKIYKASLQLKEDKNNPSTYILNFNVTKQPHDYTKDKNGDYYFERDGEKHIVTKEPKVVRLPFGITIVSQGLEHLTEDEKTLENLEIKLRQVLINNLQDTYIAKTDTLSNKLEVLHKNKSIKNITYK